VLCFALSVSAYDIVWNAQWPELCPQTAPADALTNFGIRVNEGNAFNGKVVSTLYNHAGNFTIGAWPSIDASGVEYNGGIPQLGNMTMHLAQVKADVEALFPDPAHNGYVAIDWEVWEPWLQFWNDAAPTARWNAYANKTFELAKGDKVAAIAAWNSSSLEYMVRTLETCKALRPHAKWGYYGVIGCGGGYDTPQMSCTDKIRARNDALAPLWAAGSALYPSIYSSCPYDESIVPPYCELNSSLAQKIPITLAETQRVNKAKMPIIPFTWYTLYTHKCATGPPAGLGHCPLMRNPTDLHTEFALAKSAPGVEGIIIWGSHGDVRVGTTDCAEFGAYVNSTLGPLLKSLT
jgi:hyaluronoglucosaminidase